MATSIALRRYNRRVIVLGIVYAAILLPIVWLFRHVPPGGAIAYPLAIMPALPIIGIFVNIGRYLIDERDEYLRMLMVRQTLIASGIALSAAMVVGFLESFGLVTPVPAYWFAILWFAGLGFGACVNKLTLGGDS